MEPTTKPYFFSFIIPAHNEEKYLPNTLIRLAALDYPKEFFEVLVIENGSTDATFRVAQGFSGGNVQVFKNLEKGVSKAKNFGMTKVSSESDWIVFLDADTVLEKNFLNDISDFFRKHSHTLLAIGTTRVRPLENDRWYAKIWMRLYDMGHKFTRTSYAIQIMNTPMREHAQFDPALALAEDLKFIRDLMPYGSFFYINTDSVFTSTRRFDKIGWITLFLKWNWDALVWKFKKTKKEYPVIR